MRHHVGHAEAAADFHEFAPRNNHLAAGCQRREQQQGRSGVVVDDDRRLGAGQAAQQLLGVDVAPAAGAPAEVVFERRITGRDSCHPFDRARRQRRPTKVGVDDDAAGVDDRLERMHECRIEQLRGSGFDARDGGGFVNEIRVALRDGAADVAGCRTQRVDRRGCTEFRFERVDCRPAPQFVDRRNHAEIGHSRNGMLFAPPRQFAMSPDQPKFRPLERFWPYAELPEQPSDAELAALDPDLHEALFGSKPRPFSITLVFPALETPDFTRALELARASAEFRETGSGDARRYRARFWSGDAVKLRDLFQIVGASDATEVLIDDRPVPFARELWLPLVWFLIPR